MQKRSIAMNLLQSQVVTQRNRNEMIQKIITPSYDVFINHRGKDTKRTVASLLYDHFCGLRLRPFLDNKNMKPGDKLFDKIDSAIKGCKIGVAVFSPSYCESYFCLHELAMITESKKKMIPIFCDVKPSELCIVDNGSIQTEELDRFNTALEEAKDTVGLAFDSKMGNWSDVVKNAANIVIESLVEIEGYEERMLQRYDQNNHFYSYNPSRNTFAAPKKI